MPARRLGRIFALLAVAAACPLVCAGACKPARYQIMGVVADAAGQPLVDARVYLLLDRVSEDKTAEAGVRAVPTRTNASGSYVQLIDCEKLAGVTDRPNPCAPSPKYLTVSASAPGYRMRLQVFKLKDLDIRKDAGGCMVLVPDLRLSPGP